MTIKIVKPMMRADTGKREVGLAIHKVMQEGDLVEVEITYARKSDNTPLYTGKFIGQKSMILNCPRKVIKGVPLAYVPLHQMKEIQPISEPPIIIKAEPRNLGNIPTKPCWICKGTKFWKAKWGEWFCNFCHPNPNPVVNTEEIDIVVKVKL